MMTLSTLWLTMCSGVKCLKSIEEGASEKCRDHDDIKMLCCTVYASYTYLYVAVLKFILY